MEKWTDRWVWENLQFPLAYHSYSYIQVFALCAK